MPRKSDVYIGSTIITFCLGNSIVAVACCQHSSNQPAILCCLKLMVVAFVTLCHANQHEQAENLWCCFRATSRFLYASYNYMAVHTKKSPFVKYNYVTRE